MDKSSYQMLRYSVEAEIANYNSGDSDSAAFANSLMRLFIQAASANEIKSQRAKREFLTFRRNSSVFPPSWALRKPVNPRLPTL